MPASHFCGIVPPHLLQGIASSSQNNESYRKAASESLAYHRGLIHRALRSATKHQHACLGANTTPNSSVVDEPALPSTSFIKPYDIEEKTKALIQKKLCQIWPDIGCHLSSVEASHDPECRTSPTSGCPSKYRIVFSAENSDDEKKLPGRLLRCELQAPADDHQVNDAYDNCGKVLDFYRTVLDWNSIDNDGMHAVSSVHFGKNFDNALWDSNKFQMVYGDGGELLHDFARCMDVVGHEMTHGVTVFTSPLDYEDQSGALNEHISDVFGIMIKQWADHETAAVANWLIGEGCFLPDEKGVALRSIRAPGTAYNDPRFVSRPLHVLQSRRHPSPFHNIDSEAD